MLLKLGVDISRLKSPIRKRLNLIQKLVEIQTFTEVVITSTYEGTHSPRSLHYADLAIDIRKPGTVNELVATLKSRLGSDYDVVDEHDHIHIEYDPK